MSVTNTYRKAHGRQVTASSVRPNLPAADDEAERPRSPMAAWTDNVVDAEALLEDQSSGDAAVSLAVVS